MLLIKSITLKRKVQSKTFVYQKTINHMPGQNKNSKKMILFLRRFLSASVFFFLPFFLFSFPFSVFLSFFAFSSLSFSPFSFSFLFSVFFVLPFSFLFLRLFIFFLLFPLFPFLLFLLLFLPFSKLLLVLYSLLPASFSFAFPFLFSFFVFGLPPLTYERAGKTFR